MVLELSDTLLALVVLCLLVVGMYTVSRWGNAYFERRRSGAAQERIVSNMLETAIDQRSLIRIEIQSNDLKGHRIEGVCIALDANGLQVQTVGTFASKELRGETVRVFFQNTYRRKASFFQFHAAIVDVEQDGNIRILRLTRPTALELGQKRSFFRLEPANDAVMGLGLWSLQGLALPNSVTQLPPAPLRFLPDRSDHLMLADISAGGMRLLLGEQAELPAHVGKGSPLLCLLRLKGLDSGPPLTFWFVCSVVMYIKGTEGSNFVSVRFTSWSLNEPGQKQISWFPVVKDEGVTPLSAWIMRHHLEQTKKL